MDTPNNVEQILKGALALSPEERGTLAARLIESLDGPKKEDGATQEEIDAAWAIEAEKRMREIDEGKVEPILAVTKLWPDYVQDTSNGSAPPSTITLPNGTKL